MKLRFNRFELKPSFGPRCTVDYVEILDGNSSNSNSKGRFCGNTKPEDIRSSGRYMFVRFRLDLSTDLYYRGFNATFTADHKPRTPSTCKLMKLIIIYAFLDKLFIFLRDLLIKKPLLS